jgi:hypothetical protein
MVIPWSANGDGAMTVSEYLDIAWMLGVGVLIMVGFWLTMRGDDLNDEQTQGRHHGPWGHAH